MSRFAIFGGGFGLYGYLPALASCGQQFLLPERYRSRFYARPELAPYARMVQWEEDEHAALTHANGVVLALPPTLQYDWLTRCLMHANVRYLLLEKPLAPSPEMASQLFEQLINSGKAFRIGYIFRFTSWGRQLLVDALKSAKEASHLSIQWHFMAHHFRHHVETWKRSHAEGGGIIRFYGIHIIALLAELGYSQVRSSQTWHVSPGECEKWEARFAGENLPECEVVLHSKSLKHQFKIVRQAASSAETAEMMLADLRDPFDGTSQEAQQGTLDLRVPILGQLCHSLLESDASEYDWYARAISLWDAVEKITLFTVTKERLHEKEIN